MVVSRVEDSASRIGNALSERGAIGIGLLALGGAVGTAFGDDLADMLGAGRLNPFWSRMLLGLTVLVVGFPVADYVAQKTTYSNAGALASLFVGGFAVGTLILAGAAQVRQRAPSLQRVRRRSRPPKSRVTDDSMDEEEEEVEDPTRYREHPDPNVAVERDPLEPATVDNGAYR